MKTKLVHIKMKDVRLPCHHLGTFFHDLLDPESPRRLQSKPSVLVDPQILYSSNIIKYIQS